jgi:tyrosine-protein kinase Etk/Wzc
MKNALEVQQLHLPNGPWHEPAVEGANFRALANALLQHAKLIGLIFSLAIVLGLIYLIIAEPVYRVDALMQVEQRSGSLASGVPQIAGALEQSPSTLQGDIEILRSRDLVSKAIKASNADIEIKVLNRLPIIGNWYARRYAKHTDNQQAAQAPLGLSWFSWGGERLIFDALEIPQSAYNNEFTLVALERGWALYDETNTLIAQGQVGQTTQIKSNATTGQILVKQLQANPGTKFLVAKRSVQETYEDLMLRLRVMEVAKQSGVIKLSIDSSNKDKAALFINALMRSFLGRTIEKRTVEADLSLKFLEQQLPTIKNNMENAEEALSKFRTKSSTLNVEQETIAGFQRSISLRRDKLDLELRQQQLSQRFEPGHPELKSVQNQLRVVNSELAKLDGSINRLPANQRDLVRLQREVDTNSALYTALVNKTQELRVARAGMTSSATMIDPASASSEPIRPRTMVVLSIASGMGLILGFLATFIATLVRPTIRDIDSLTSQTGLNAVMSIPLSTKQNTGLQRLLPAFAWGKDRLLSLHAPDEPAIESLRSFRTSLTLPTHRQEANQKAKIILLTSPTSGVGKSFVSANIAALLSSLGKRVLLIEADMRKPSLHKYFGIRHSIGLAEVLMQTADFNEAVRFNVLPGLDFLLAGRPKANPCDLLSSSLLPQLLDQVGERYDFVVIDSAPVLPVGDTLAIMRHPMSIYMIARSEHSTLREVQDAVRRIAGVGGDIEGLLFNGVKRSRLSDVRYSQYFMVERT